MSVLARLDDFRGISRFTTWACKFALLEAAVKLRKRAWQGRELPREPETWSLFSSKDLGPDAAAEQSELVRMLQRGIEEVLTQHQRGVGYLTSRPLGRMTSQTPPNSRTFWQRICAGLRSPT
jgi:RNA polymerase sigma-70 factor, ECF subfamily